MTNHGQLSNRLHQQIQAESKAIDQLGKLESIAALQSLNDEFQSVLNTIRADMENQLRFLNQELMFELHQCQRNTKKLNKLLRMSWIKPLVVGASLWLGICGGSYAMMQYLSSQISGQLQAINRNQLTLKVLNQQGGNLHLARCGEYRQICAQIDDRQIYQDGYRILVRQ